MGMYDTINGEQVKCFPWVSFYHNEVDYHGGDFKYYGIGDEVPYKRPHYNYGKNFIILDLNRHPEGDYCDYDYILHVIVDGKVQNTFTDEIGEINWSINENVIGYKGEILNIHNSEDILNYIKDQRNYLKEYEEINKYWNKLFSESMQYFTGLGLLDKDSEEFKFRKTKCKEYHLLMEKEREKIKPELEALTKKYEKWYVDTSDIEDLTMLGDYISAYYTELKAGRDSARTCSDMIGKLLDEDNTLYERYMNWQGFDENIKDFLPENTKEID